MPKMPKKHNAKKSAKFTKVAPSGATKGSHASPKGKSRPEQPSSRAPKPASIPKGWLYGRHAVIAALTAGRRELQTLWLIKSDSAIEALAKKTSNLRIEYQERSAFDALFPDVNHQGIALQAGGLPRMHLEDVTAHPRLLMLDQVTDPHNLGAILRTADAFGFAAVLTPSYNAASVNDVVAKTACGALETVPVIEVGNLNNALKTLQEEDFWSIGLAGEATQTLNDVIAGGLPEKICVVMGSEGEGLRRLVAENCDYLVKIPMIGTAESLNVSVATGIVLQALMKG